MSVGLGHMAVHVEVPGDLGEGEFSSFQLRREHNLAAQPGVLLEEGGHVQHVVLPGARRAAVSSGHTGPAVKGTEGRKEAPLRLLVWEGVAAG